MPPGLVGIVSVNRKSYVTQTPLTIYRKDPVFIAGQALGVLVYLRNLYFLLHERQAPATVPAAE